ncbi:MAG TPA: glycine betaine ABC transporter substrate-binding protein [Solirubrobacteraceae bacterium]|nr:glycine betaine ABC transporter substrate-binding protein [Solirubrobacteraceae bacterium]
MTAVRRRTLALLMPLALAAALGACGGGSDDDARKTTDRATPVTHEPIRIGSKNFTEQAILGELYRQALEAKGFDVQLKADIGSTEIIHRALRRGALDMYPEYVGVLLSEIAEDRSRPTNAKAAYEVARKFEQQGGFTMLPQTPFSNPNALGVKPEFAKRHNLRTIADLKRLRGRVQIGALPEFRTRYEGLDGLREVYGLTNLRVTAVESNERYTALDSGAVDIASVFRTEGQLAGDSYVVLEDPKGLFASGHVAPIVSDEVLDAHGPGLRSAIDAVTKALTTPHMRKMNAAVDLLERKPAEVATEFLQANNLLSASSEGS